jgi:Ca-activated chloride channel family protein
MIFASPSWFYLLLLLPLLAIYQYRQRRKDAVTFSSVSLFKGSPKTWRQRFLFIPPLCFYLALTAFIFALARPQRDVVNQRQDREGIAIQMLIDVSSSMDMSIRYGDKDETRMEVAKKVVEEFVIGNGKDLKGRIDDLIGIVTFARYADTVCPMTLSHDALVNIVRDLKINDRPNEDGTAYGDAAALAAARLKDLETRDAEDNVASKIIVLLTDGENNCGMHLPLQAAAMAKEWGIRIYTISIQNPPESNIVRSEKGEFLTPEERSPSDKVLSQMAEMTGGIFRTAYDFDSLQAVYSKIDSLEKSKMKAVNYIDKEEAFPLFAFAGLLLLFIQNLLTATIFRIAP